MNLANGTVLGPYEILSPIGAGGMGEVYRARDTRLDRIVAIKVLPAGVATGTMRARFEREAKAISGLNHPNICALYDVGHHDGVDYLVMEHLEGESLADRVSRGALPLSQVVRYGAEIAQALDHAHRRGITHRDLKPGNVMIAASGAKLLDFGLAKLVEPSGEMSEQSETVTRRSRSRPKERSSERCRTCLPSMWKGRLSITAVTSFRWGPCSMRWPLAGVRSRVARKPRSWRRSSRPILRPELSPHRCSIA